MGEDTICWYCGSEWRSSPAHAAMAAAGVCLVCGTAPDDPEVRGEAVCVLEGDELVLTNFNEAAHALTGGAVAELAGRPAADIFGDVPEFAQAERIARRPGLLHCEHRQRIGTIGVEHPLMVRVRSAVPGRLVIGARLLPAT